jgi:hypothetical protein
VRLRPTYTLPQSRTSLEEDVSDDVTLWLAVCELVAVALLLLVIEPVFVAVAVCTEGH